jgi:hypothetical protein
MIITNLNRKAALKIVNKMTDKWLQVSLCGVL